ncbi:hypothetical protein B0H13DRAFT_2371262 [Mycena leptocephala]|nr:hypothetical protein B0H13DRAFT_2371262 [Mycena leptocephala]
MLIYVHADDRDYVVRIVRFDCGTLDVDIQSLGITRIPLPLGLLHDLCYPIPSPIRLHLALSTSEKCIGLTQHRAGAHVNANASASARFPIKTPLAERISPTMVFAFFPVARLTNEIPPMAWDLVTFTREQIKLEQTDNSKTVKALLMPDGISITGWVWVRVPLHQGVQRAFDVDEVDTDVWLDAGRGIGRASSDLTNRSFQIDRYPLDEPRDLVYSYTIVVASQHTEGPDVHPINHNIARLVPDLDVPWRGNVLVFRHGKSASKVLINVEEKNCTAIEWIVSTPLPHPFWSTADVVLYMLQFLSLVNLVKFSHTDKLCQLYAKTLIKGRITRYTSPFFTKNVALHPSVSRAPTMFTRFFQTLEDTRSWVVGSVALAAASVLSDAPCPTNLNVITHERQLGTWVRFMVGESGFHVGKRGWSSGPYVAAGGLVFEFTHARIRTYSVVISTTRDRSLGEMFFASPNTDQLVAIAAYELITPVLYNVSEQQHLKGWRSNIHRGPSLPIIPVHPAYRDTPRFPGVTTLDADTSSWSHPCGWSCPGVWRSACGLDGIAHIKWGGLDDLDEYTDPTLLELGRGRMTFRFGVRCENPLCNKSPKYVEPLVDSDPNSVSAD